MKVDRLAAEAAFHEVRAAQKRIELAIASGSQTQEVVRLLRSSFEPAVKRAGAAGVFTGYFERWSKNLYNSTPTRFSMVAEPAGLGFTAVPLKEGADVEAGQSALDRLRATQSVILRRVQRRKGEGGEQPRCRWSDRILKDQLFLKRAVSKVRAAGVDPSLIEPSINAVAARVYGTQPPAERAYAFIARQHPNGSWSLDPLGG